TATSTTCWPASTTSPASTSGTGPTRASSAGSKATALSWWRMTTSRPGWAGRASAPTPSGGWPADDAACLRHRLCQRRRQGRARHQPVPGVPLWRSAPGRDAALCRVAGGGRRPRELPRSGAGPRRIHHPGRRVRRHRHGGTHRRQGPAGCLRAGGPCDPVGRRIPRRRNGPLPLQLRRGMDGGAMKDGVEYSLTGVDEITKKLKALSVDMRLKGGRAALRKAGNVVLAQARANAASVNDPKTPEEIAKNLVMRWSPRAFKRTGDLMFRVGILGGARRPVDAKAARKTERRRKRLGQ